jgi:diguanylate cyclase (GGDEF)-like protein
MTNPDSPDPAKQTVELTLEIPVREPPSRTRLLVLEPDQSSRRMLEKLFGDGSTDLVLVDKPAQVRAQLTSALFDVALMDLDLSQPASADLLAFVRAAGSGCAAVLMSASLEFDAAVKALRLGAADFLVKPFANAAAVKAAIHKTARVTQLERRNRQLITELRASNEALQALALRDPLTGLYNHGYVQEIVEREIARSTRHGVEVALVMIDLDRFKSINDRHGHSAGDRLLRSFSELLMGKVPSGARFRLRGQDVAARYGGDEFALVLPETSKQGAAILGERLRQVVERENIGPEGGGTSTVSLGIAVFPHDASDRDGLIDAAGAALYAAKRQGRNVVVGYTPSLDRKRDPEGLAMHERTQALDQTIAERRCKFVYQPIVHADSHQPFAYEALCRPTHPEFPHPGALFETAELTGRVVPLGRVVREGAVKALEVLPEGTTLFVNLHPLELNDPEFSSIEPFMARWAGQVVFELTEVAAIRHHGRVRDIIRMLRARGFRVALDDLGAGYSGLNALAQLEPDFVKLDMELVRRLPSDARTRRLVKHVLEFADEEGMTAIAEGIETEEERSIITELGCPLLQGYYFSRPRPVQELLGG